ncbi:glycosyltransferase family 9 protein [Planctomycetota bacterium]
MYYKIVNRKKKLVVGIADFLGYIFWAPINILRKRTAIATEVRKILIIRMAYIGDVVMTLPILRPLKELHPEAKITFLTSSIAKNFLVSNPYIDEIITYDAFWFYSGLSVQSIMKYWRFLKILRSKSYDLVIEARGDIRNILLIAYLSKSKWLASYKVGGGGFILNKVVPFHEIKHRVDYHLDIVKSLGGQVDTVEWDIYLDQQEKASVESLLAQKGVVPSNRLVGIHPGARETLKCWAGERYAKVADHLIYEHGAIVLFTGSPTEKKLVDLILEKMDNAAVNLVGETDLRLLSALIEKLDLLICNDSAPLHIASALNTPTVAIFGPSKSRETGPYGNVHRVVEKKFPCRFCCDEHTCRYRMFNECMNQIETEDVLAAVKEVFADNTS